ncbi:MAG: uracil-DNA glycosylase [Actinomycetota bacterium]|jgi:uracil DNA glycosylase|nr:uracil-DNA glycosylase [Actinomycetota bacterium]
MTAELDVSKLPEHWALENDPAIRISRPHNGDLTSWAKSGVLLLNTALTVEEGGGSHARRWKHFTDLVLQVINEDCAHVAFLLWGSPDKQPTPTRDLGPSRWTLTVNRFSGLCRVGR